MAPTNDRDAPAPDYDEDAAQTADDWADVPGAPDQLHDAPTRCAFCQQFIPITQTDPVLLIGKPWRTPDRGYLFAAHERCLLGYGEGRVPALTSASPVSRLPTAQQRTVALIARSSPRASPEAALLSDRFLAAKAADDVMARLPAYSGGKTQGIFEAGGKQVDLISGYKGPSASLPRGTPGMHGNIKSHVEAHAAALMRQGGIDEATLYINQIPCRGVRACDAMLPESARLHVRGPNGFRKTYTGLPD
jgi:hypothetical protein